MKATYAALKSLHFEKLKGERGNRGERSIRLNKQFRLILTISSDDRGKLLLILDIEDYHLGEPPWNRICGRRDLCRRDGFYARNLRHGAGHNGTLPLFSVAQNR